VAEIIDYTYDIKGILIKLADGESIDFMAGQYVQH
jgi:ferredoxin-NADP reductase